MVRPRRVMVCAHTAEIGGAERALIRLLTAIDRDRFAVAVCLFERGPLETAFADIGVPVQVVAADGLQHVTRRDAAGARRVFANAAAALRQARRVAALLRAQDVDLAVANSLKSAVVLFLAAPLARRRWVWHLHDRVAVDYLPRALVIALRLIARIGPYAVVANSTETAATVGRVRGGRTTVAYPGLESDEFDDPRTPGADGAVALVGRISATKGQRVFLDAVELLAKRGFTAEYRIVGAAMFDDHGEERDVRERVARSSALRTVEVTGWSDDPRRELRRLRLLVHASPVPEPFGQVIVEAMAAGVPVVAADAGAVPEILAPDGWSEPLAPGVRAGRFGVLARPGDAAALADAIQWTSSHPREVEASAAAARESVRERFTVEQTAAVVARAWAAASRRKKNP